jgi:hypothetical protein
VNRWRLANYRCRARPEVKGIIKCKRPAKKFGLMKLSKEITRQITYRLKNGRSLPTKGRYLPTTEEY